MNLLSTARRDEKRRWALPAASTVVALLAMLFVPALPASAAPGDFVSGVVIVDANKNEVVDAGSPGETDLPLAGVAVTLRGSDAAHPGWTTVTGADGSWGFPADDYSASPGPYTVTLSTAGIDDDAFITYPGPSADNDFSRAGGAQEAVSAPFADGGDVVLNALVFPTWSLDLALAADPAGFEGNSVYTGTPVFDADDSQPGRDAGQDNDRVRSADIVSYNWSLTAASEAPAGPNFSDTYFEQTIHLEPGAVANFVGVPAVCESGQIVAQPSGTVIPGKQDPPAGTTSVVLSCNLGSMGEDRAAILLPTMIQPSSTSANGSTFTTSARSYAVDPEGVATAQPSVGVENGPIEITAAPRYDVEKIAGSSGPGTIAIDGVATPGYFMYYTVQISTDRKVGVEAFEQPVTLEESFWGVHSVPGPNGEAVGSPVTGLKWYMDQCVPSPSPASAQAPGTLVYGKIGGAVADETNSVRDSGTCALSRAGSDTDNYELTLSGIDTSGASYPTQTAGGSSLAAGPFYVASYRVRVFMPSAEIDKLQGAPSDGVGEISISNRVGNFDPSSATGASNFGDGFEPGYCAAGPGSDGSTNCAAMEDGTRSNNVAGPTTIRIGPGTWGKYFYDNRTAWTLGVSQLPEVTITHGGSGQVQPGQSFTSIQTLHNTGLDMNSAEMCDVFDSTVLKLAPLAQDSVTNADQWEPDRYSAVGADGLSVADQKAHQANWVVKYGHVDLSGDDPNNGTFDLNTDRFEGDWSKQRAATDGATTACGSPDITWYDSPADVPGGVDGVNVAWAKTAAGYVVPSGQISRYYLAFEQRDTYNGGPHAGEQIPAGTVAVNYGALKTSTWNQNWSAAAYIPGAGNTNGPQVGENGSVQGDRWTVARAQMKLQKRTVAADVGGVPATGVSNFGITGAALAGKPVVWEIVSTLTAASADPAPVNDVVVTDTLPKYTIYNEAATVALAGGTVPSSATVNPDGTTTLVWNLGTRTPNQDLPLLKVVTDIDPLAPNNTTAVNTATVKGAGITPVRAHTDDHTIRLEQSGELQLKKSVDRNLDLQDDDQVYTLQMKNFSETLAIQAPTVIDVLPYNGDATNDANVNRSPASDLTGQNLLAAAPEAFEFDRTTPLAGTFYYTTVDPADVPQDLTDDTDPSIWSTTFSSDATAFKFVAANSLSTSRNASKSGLTITFTTDQVDNSAGDLYSNRFTAFSDTLKNGDAFQLLTSNLVSVRVVGFSLGDLIWADLDGDGTFTEGTDRVAPEGVTVEVFNAADVKVGETTTDADGRWVVNKLAEGDYYAVIPGAEFAAGGLLEGYAPAPGAETDPNTDNNEDTDHHAIAGGGGVRSAGLITLNADTQADPIVGLEPLGDNVAGVKVAPLTTDDFTNLTLDLALIPPAKFTVSKMVDGEAAAYGTGPFTVQVSCEFNGAGVAGYPRDVVFNGAGSEELTAPLGSICTATETATGSATTVTVTPEKGIALESEDSDVAITVTNTFDAGSFQIRKDVEGVGASLTGGEYTFDAVCSFNGVADAFTHQLTITDDGTGSMVSEEVTGVPVGAECTITETGNGDADDTPAPVTIVIDADPETTQIVGFLNEFSAGTVQIEKSLEGASKDDVFLAGLTYDVQLTCQLERDGERIDLFGAIIGLTPGEPVVAEVDGAPVLLPVGTRCFAEELVDQGAASVTVDFDSYENAVVVEKGSPDAPQELAISVVNTFDAAKVTVSKTVVGPDAGGPYSFEMSCTYPVETEAGIVDETYPLAEEDAMFELRDGQSRTISVPTGTSCGVVETNAPADATVTVVDSDPTSAGGDSDGVVTKVAGEDNSIAVTNTFPAAPGLSVTGGTLRGGLIAGGGVLLLAGLAVLLVARRKKSRLLGSDASQ